HETVEHMICIQRPLSFALAAVLAATAVVAAQPAAARATAPDNGTTERLDRGLVSLRAATGNFLSWRLLPADVAGAGFAVYRDGVKVTTTTVTNYLDAGAPA